MIWFIFQYHIFIVVFNLQAVYNDANDCIRLLLEANAIIGGKTIERCNYSDFGDKTSKKLISDEMINRVSNLDNLNAVWILKIIIPHLMFSTYQKKGKNDKK